MAMILLKSLWVKWHALWDLLQNTSLNRGVRGVLYDNRENKTNRCLWLLKLDETGTLGSLYYSLYFCVYLKFLTVKALKNVHG